jgi:nitric oxide reductase large subunit
MKKLFAFLVVLGLAIGIGMGGSVVHAEVEPEDFTDFEELLPLP